MQKKKNRIYLFANIILRSQFSKFVYFFLNIFQSDLPFREYYFKNFFKIFISSYKLVGEGVRWESGPDAPPAGHLQHPSHPHHPRQGRQVCSQECRAYNYICVNFLVWIFISIYIFLEKKWRIWGKLEKLIFQIRKSTVKRLTLW